MSSHSALGTRHSVLQKLRLWLLDYPLLVREVRTRMRGTRTFVVLFVYDFVLILFMGLIYAERTRHTYWLYSNVELGRYIFSFVAYAQLILMLLVAPAMTSGSIAAERERRSLDIMAISLLTPREIVWGKLLSSTSYSLILLISSVPLVGICFLFGGLGPMELCKSIALIVSTTFFFSSMALFFSSLCKRTVVAVVLTFVGVLLIAGGIPLTVVLIGEIFNWSTNDYLWLCMLLSSPFAMATVVDPSEFSTLVFGEHMWAVHSGLHAGLTLLWLALAAHFVAYPKVKE